MKYSFLYLLLFLLLSNQVAVVGQETGLADLPLLSRWTHAVPKRR
jgi:hypothetical protein